MALPNPEDKHKDTLFKVIGEQNVLEHIGNKANTDSWGV